MQDIQMAVCLTHSKLPLKPHARKSSQYKLQSRCLALCTAFPGNTKGLVILASTLCHSWKQANYEFSLKTGNLSNVTVELNQVLLIFQLHALPIWFGNDYRIKAVIISHLQCADFFEVSEACKRFHWLNHPQLSGYQTGVCLSSIYLCQDQNM